MKYTSLIWIFFTLGQCKSNEICCQLFNETKFEIYCERFNDELPAHCLINFDIISNPFDVLQLKIGGCDHQRVTSVSGIYTEIRVLDISQSHYSNLEWLSIVVERFKKLHIFNASHNEIRTLSTAFMAMAPKLTDIDLSYNRISVIGRDNHFVGAVKLQKVNLAFNTISFIHTDTFIDSPDLQSVDLRENRLFAIQTFPPNEKLNRIHLDGNQITQFHCSFLLARNSTSSSISLHVSWQHLYEFDRFRTCNNQQWHVIVDNELDDGIWAASNGTREFYCHEQTFDYLIEFYANQNAFKNVIEILPCIGSSVEIMDLSDSTLNGFDANSFDRFIVLKRLYLSGTMLSEFDAAAFENQKNHLQVLDVSRNNLTALLNMGAFCKLQKLEAASNPNLANVREIIEELPKSIIYLDVSDGPIESPNVTTFDHLTALQTLKLSNTNLKFVDFNPFQPLRQLLTLDISNNNFSNVNFSILSNTLNKLMELNVANCHIANVQMSELVRHLRVSIEQLDLSENNLVEFDFQAFSWLFNLRYLNLSNCNLLHFDSTILRELRELSVLDLSKNELHVIDLKWLPVQLEWLNLNANELNQIDSFGTTISDKMTLGISMNRLPCSYLTQLTYNFDDLKFIGDPLKQKHQQICRFN